MSGDVFIILKIRKVLVKVLDICMNELYALLNFKN